jgi:hypothetical protein
MLGLQSGTMIMPVDPEKQPKIPQHDFADNKLYITPSAHRFIDKKCAGNKVDGYENLETVRDNQSCHN